MRKPLPGMLPNRLVVRGVTRRHHIEGYDGLHPARYHQIGYRAWYGRFVVLDEEEVPNDVWISGNDGGNAWRSKFGNWIPNARGGDADRFTRT